MTAVTNLIVRLDKAIFQAINSLAGKSSLLDGIARVGADDHIIPLILAILVILLVFIAKGNAGKKRALEAFVCAVLAVAIANVILACFNLLWFRARPFTTEQVNLIFYRATDSSFPSNAASSAFAISFATLFYERKVGGVMLGLSLYLALSRVFVGIHYPLDVFSGLLLGLGAASVSLALAPLYRPITRYIYRKTKVITRAWKNPPP